MAKLIMLKFLCIPAFFSIALFLLTGFAVAGKPKTFGIKTGKSLFDIKNKVLPETMVSNSLDPIGLDVKVVPHKDEEKVLDVKGISSLDRAQENSYRDSKFSSPLQEDQNNSLHEKQSHYRNH